MTTRALQPAESRYGWVMVGISAIIIGVANGSVLSVSVFLKPLEAEFGWLRAEVSGGYIAASLSVGVGGILMGYLADRFPVRRVVLVGIIALAGSYLLLSTLHSTWEYYLYYCLMGGVGIAAILPVLIANVGTWFSKNMGLALGLTTAGQALGQGFVPYVGRLLITEFGWRGAYTWMGLGTLALLLPLVLLIKPAPAVQKAGQTGSEVSRKGFPVAPRVAVAWISAAALFCCVCMATPLIHVVALGQEMGFSGNLAASILLPIYVTGFFGRIIFGRVADRLGGIPTYLIASAGQTAAVFFFTQMKSLTGFYALGPIYGFFFSGVMTSFVITTAEMTPVNRRGISTGIVMLFAWIGMGLGGWQGGFFYDLTGNYFQSFGNAVGAGVINLIIVGSLFWYNGRRRLAFSAVPATT